MLTAITAGLQACAEFFGWRKQTEINKPGQQKRNEIQEIRKERDDNVKKIDDWANSPKP